MVPDVLSRDAGASIGRRAVTGGAADDVVIVRPELAGPDPGGGGGPGDIRVEDDRIPVVMVCRGSRGMAAAWCCTGDIGAPRDRGCECDDGIDTAPVVTMCESSWVEL